MTQERFNYILCNILNNAGYFKTATIHALHRALAKQVNGELFSSISSQSACGFWLTVAIGKYTLEQTAQALTHRNKDIYEHDYIANCSLIDTVGAVLDKQLETSHIEYFQGFGQFHERGLPRDLPAEEEEKLLQNSDLMHIASKIQRLTKENAEANVIMKEKRQYGILLARLQTAACQCYQSEWVQKQRDWKITTRGKVRPKYFVRTDLVQSLSKIMPELGCLAEVMLTNKPLSFNEKLVVVKDMYTQCTCDFNVVYCPGEEPIAGLCPVEGCQKAMDR